MLKCKNSLTFYKSIILSAESFDAFPEAVFQLMSQGNLQMNFSNWKKRTVYLLNKHILSPSHNPIILVFTNRETMLIVLEAFQKLNFGQLLRLNQPWNKQAQDSVVQAVEVCACMCGCV